MRVEPNNLRAAIEARFRHVGASPAEAEQVAEHLVASHLAGHDTHGVSLAKIYVDAIARNELAVNTPPTRHTALGPVVSFDGRGGLGIPAANELTRTVIDSAREFGVGLAYLRNSGHVGRLGAYGERIVAHGMCALIIANAAGGPPRVAPYGAGRAVLSANPICLAVPTTDPDRPFVTDLATSAVSLGHVRLPAAAGRQLAEGVAIDANGQPTTDPMALLAEPRGSILAFGEHRGSAINLFCELLAGGLLGGDTCAESSHHGEIDRNNVTMIAIDSSRIHPLSAGTSSVTAVLAKVRDAPPASGHDRVDAPGDRSARQRADRGHIDIDEATWAWLISNE